MFFGAPAPSPLTVGPRLMLTAERAGAAPLLGGDQSGDGFGDVFLATPWSVDLVWMGGPGSLTSAAFAGRWDRARPLLDVNDDAVPDVAIVNPSVSVFYSIASGWVAEPVRLDGLDVGPAAVAPVGDVNGDGHRDVAFAASAAAGARAGIDPGGASPRADVYLGSSVGLDRALRAPPPAPAGTSIVAGAAGDVDGDGRGDLIVVPRRSGELWWYRGGAAGLAASPEVLRDPRWAAVDAVGLPRDVDGDGFDDVVLGAPTRGACTSSTGPLRARSPASRNSRCSRPPGRRSGSSDPGES